MDKNVKVIGANETDSKNSVTIRITVKDYFPDDNSGVEFFEVGPETYNDLCRYKELMASLVGENDADAVKIDIRRFYPHLCRKEKWVYVTHEMYESQLDHVNCRKTVLIKPHDLMEDYRDCPEYMEVSNEICMELAKYRNEDIYEKEKMRRKRDGKGFEEVARGEINGMYQEDNTRKIDLHITVRELFTPFGEILTNRAVMYLCYAQTPTMIARHDGISVHSAWESVEKIKSIVKNAGKEYFGM
ncbi:MAG: hypothetical protein E7494_14335 [Ruminococcus albus]|nr:hypothetical protein [Ruminococcus albus]